MIGRSLPRCYRPEGQAHEMTLQQALRRGVSPLCLLIEDEVGRWVPYMALAPRKPRPAARDRDSPIAIPASGLGEGAGHG